ncbi:hypothetical protein [Hyphomicrobium sp. CS1BSMeth3]|uniref:hypothetical protein n=1 Tax=Hyphomicrobium sp. CS1BSMeth3 TaxID=1892844 RepID=UPI000930136B|nr:hypothetical protein [Hyphomicrobium sp. CS1BSMeth3]
MARGGAKPGERRGGRRKGTPNRATADIKAAAQLHGAAALERLAYLMTNADSEAAQVAAAKEILDRAYGKAPQALTVDPGDKFTDMLKAFLGSIDGRSRGLPQHRPPMATSPVSTNTDLPH